MTLFGNNVFADMTKIITEQGRLSVQGPYKTPYRVTCRHTGRTPCEEKGTLEPRHAEISSDHQSKEEARKESLQGSDARP